MNHNITISPFGFPMDVEVFCDPGERATWGRNGGTPEIPPSTDIEYMSIDGVPVDPDEMFSKAAWEKINDAINNQLTAEAEAYAERDV